MRRGNKSHKVPNVKLRPALLPTRIPQGHGPDASCDVSSDSDIPPNASVIDFCPRPFRRFYICATGPMDKSALFKMAVDLGAESTSDFTDRVTHLLANSHGGAKYLCAVERKIPIMTPDWITESHAIWLRGDDVNVEQSVTKHRLPIFSGVVLSLSGIEDIDRSAEINRIVTAHQGTYLEHLERPVKVTHLLCSGDAETDKMKYAEKFNRCKEAQIQLVWEEWFWDSLDFGGRFDERKYQASRPRPEKRKSLSESLVSTPLARDSAAGSYSNPVKPVDYTGQRRRLKPIVPTGSFTVINNLANDEEEEEEEEIAIINRPVASMTLQLWQSLLKPRGFEVDSGKLVRSPSKPRVTPPPSSARSLVQPNATHRNGTGVQNGKEKEKESVISSFRRANSFVSVPLNEPIVRQPFRRNMTCPSIGACEAEGNGPHDAARQEELNAQAFFSGYTFRLLGEARCPNVRLAIENRGGVVTDDDAEEPSFIIVRLISGSKLYRDEFDDYARTKYRTECWLEHSVFHERICESDENVTFTPLKILTPVPAVEKINLSLSGLDQSQLYWVRRLVRAVGATSELIFSRRSTHLICPCGTGAKYEKALEWNIPVVSLAWLEDIAKTGTIPCIDKYLVGESSVGTPIHEQDSFGCAELLEPVSEVRGDKGKGKGKEKEIGYQMMGIINDGANRPMFVKNAEFLQETVAQDWESDARHSRSEPMEPMPSQHNGLFGKPRFLLRDSDPPEEANDHDDQTCFAIPSQAEPPPPSSSPLAAGLELHQLPLPSPSKRAPLACRPSHPVHYPSGFFHGADSVAQANTQTGTRIQILTQTQAQTPVQTQGQIPSSTSPSPMKLPPSSLIPDPFIPPSSSPARINDTEAITKALYESLTSLLGKRPITEDDGAAKGMRKGKRVRPGGQSSFASREASRENFNSPAHTVVHLPVPLPPPPPPDLDTSGGLFDAMMGGGPRSTEESLRVTYEDPVQAEEKRRLLRILGGGDSGETDGMRTMGGGDKGVSVGASRMRRTRRAKGGARS